MLYHLKRNPVIILSIVAALLQAVQDGIESGDAVIGIVIVSLGVVTRQFTVPAAEVVEL